MLQDLRLVMTHSGMLRSLRYARLIRRSGLFDAEYYLAQCRDDPGARRDPVRHFLRTGAPAGLNPSAAFDTRAYVRAFPEAARSGKNPLVHYIRHGDGTPAVSGPAPAPAAPPYSSAALRELLSSAPGIHGGGAMTFRLEEDTLRFLDAHVSDGTRTLETGAGVSTLLFAFKRAQHVAITPSADEVSRLEAHCRASGVSTERVDFRIAFSHDVLPQLAVRDLDLALIDGGHGFPVPFLDWFFIAPRLRLGALLVVDDTNLWTGRVLSEFLASDRDWEPVATFPRGAAFRKLGDRVGREWNEQPYVTARSVI